MSPFDLRRADEAVSNAENIVEKPGAGTGKFIKIYKKCRSEVLVT